MKQSVQRVVNALAEAGIRVIPTEFAESTRTAEDAAAAIGTTVGQIVKSLVFLNDQQPILLLVSGPNRVDVAAVGKRLGMALERASAEQVRAATSFSIGGVAPVGHAGGPLPTWIDADLMSYEIVWAAAGTPNTVFPISPEELRRITSADVLPMGGS
jgi:prolyl-tRNA editing enzyme YbaK/EbsC (Cys-tRNA(Pro) deacylase)